MHRTDLFAHAWNRDGKIFVVTEENGPKIRITGIDELNEIKAKKTKDRDNTSETEEQEISDIENSPCKKAQVQTIEISGRPKRTKNKSQAIAGTANQQTLDQHVEITTAQKPKVKK